LKQRAGELLSRAQVHKHNDRAIQIANNCKRYISDNFYESISHDSCSICYQSVGEIIEARFICGHLFCIDCVIRSISYAKKCPLCNEYIGIRDVIITRESINGYQSNLVDFFKKIYHNTFVITNIDNISVIQDHVDSNILVENINKWHESIRCPRFSDVKYIIFLTTKRKTISRKDSKCFMRARQYFKLFDHKPEIIEIELSFQKNN
jgi:hypothetical protein